MIKKFVEPLDEAALSVLGEAPVEGGQQLQMAQFPLQFAKAITLKEAIQSLLSKDGKVSSVELENKLVVVDYASSLVLVVLIRSISLLASYSCSLSSSPVVFDTNAFFSNTSLRSCSMLFSCSNWTAVEIPDIPIPWKRRP